MRVKVFIDRNVAFLAGKNQHGPMVIDVDPVKLTPEERQALVDFQKYASSDSNADFSLRENQSPPRVSLPAISCPEDAILQIQALPAALAEYEAREAQAKEAKRLKEEEEKRIDELRKDEAVTRFFADPSARAKAYVWNNNIKTTLPGDKDREFPADSPIVVEIQRRNAADKAKEAAKEEGERLTKQREEEAKAEFLRGFIAEHGTPSQQERMLAGFLAEEKMLTSVREHFFAPLDFPQYEKIKHSEICTCDEDGSGCYDENCKLKGNVWKEGFSVSESQYAAFVALRDNVLLVYPEATIVLREHECETACCEKKLARLGALVTLVAGPFAINRDFSI